MDAGITKENLLLILPPALTHDPAMMARAAADAEALEARLAEIDRVRIISNIDGLDEAVLDILAYDFKVDWWDADYSLEEKRRTLKGSWRVHKTLGTKAAVETAIRAVYPAARIEEWFEYGGEPYHFRLTIDLTNDQWDEDRQRRVLDRLNFYKSLRSHVDSVDYFTRIGPICFTTGIIFRFSSFTQHLRFTNIRRPWVRFDGARSFDGAFAFGQEPAGINLPRFVLSGRFSNLRRGRAVRFDGEVSFGGEISFGQTISGVGAPAFGIRAHFRKSVNTNVSTFSVRQRLPKQSGDVKAVSVVFSAAFSHAHTVSAALTTDSWWTLDGSAPMDGSRKFNAGIIKEEL